MTLRDPASDSGTTPNRRIMLACRVSRRLLASSAPRVSMRHMAFMPTPIEPSGIMAVSQPYLPSVPRSQRLTFALAGLPPLLDQILKLPSLESPHRIISYDTDDDREFNCATFDDDHAYTAYRSWFLREAVDPAGRFHAAWAKRFRHRAASELPSAENWLWGAGHRVLSDSRAGEYQIGHGHRYSRMIFRDDKARLDAEQAAVDPQFEKRIAQEMEQEGIEYFGRLVLAAPADDKSGRVGGWFTKSRYGSLQDAQRGTWLIKEFLFPEEMKRWFLSYETVTGSIASTHLITPRLPDGSKWLREASA